MSQRESKRNSEDLCDGAKDLEDLVIEKNVIRCRDREQEDEIPARKKKSSHTSKREVEVTMPGEGGESPDFPSLELYVSACVERAVKPNAEITRLFTSNTSNIVVINLDNNYLGDVGCIVFASVMNVSLPNLRFLSLASNGVANSGVSELCTAIEAKESAVAAIDLRDNPKITRVGGQRLLSFAGRCDRILFMLLASTRITDYFERRIEAHIARHLAAANPDAVSSLLRLTRLQMGEDVGGEEEGEDEEDPEGEERLPPMGPRVGSTMPQHHVPHTRSRCSTGNEEYDANLALYRCNRDEYEAYFDEAWYVCDEDSEIVVQRPMAPSNLSRAESVLYAATPDFISVGPRTDSVVPGKFTITHIPERDRTVYGPCTPTQYELDIFAYVDAYTPKEIELPAHFIFPGKIDYFPAVHGPDPIISIPPPTLVKRATRTDVRLLSERSSQNSTPRASEPESATVAPAAAEVPSPALEQQVQNVNEDQGMYWNFFHTASRSEAGSQPATPRDRATPRQSPRSALPPPFTAALPIPAPPARDLETQEAETERRYSPVPPLPLPPQSAPLPDEDDSEVVEDYLDGAMLSLHQVNNAVCMSEHQLGRGTRIVSSDSELRCTKGLAELLTDPLWNPSNPTRNQQVEDYCTSNKLRYNVVSKERVMPKEPVNRDFILQRMIRPSKTDKLTAGTMNHKGTMLATCSYNMTCTVWDLETGKKIFILAGHEGHLCDCCWTKDDGLLVTGSFDATCKVWDATNGNLVKTLKGHELEVICLAMGPTGEEFASTGMDDIAIVWDIAGGCEKHSLVGHTAEVVCAEFSPVGSMLATGSMDETVRVWNTVSGVCLHVLEDHTGEVSQVHFNCFGNTVLSGSVDGTCRLWDAATGKRRVLRGHTHEVVDCAFSADGWLCASASDDGTARVWDILTGGCLSMMVGHTKGVCRVTFTDDPHELITGSIDTTAKVWNIATATCTQTLRGHKGVVLVQYCAASERILTMSKDNTCRIWKKEPKTDTLFHMAAVAICQHPTIASEVMSSGVLPQNLQDLLSRVHKKIFRSEGEQLTAATPLPSMRSNDDHEAGEESIGDISQHSDNTN